LYYGAVHKNSPTKAIAMYFVKSTIAAATLFAVGATAAQASDYQSFKHEGVTYTYKVIEKNDHQIIVGTSDFFGETKKFRLILRNGKVRGDVAGNRIAFSTSKVLASDTRLALD
jgi:hypothetical protein